ncbi:5-amino-6-(5-phosphoribosylamino)uracil reductase [Haloterrigena salina JCM 13891]|uniref:5-amino-6-(5-phosphoribosylamino)uracil reductase n=1 Tax=Haloterrigena salina JCM 13891 TaxID=1227488 RepID=M0C2L2_9EURY|nr:5-amino-6-(5-phosphoribosylamino)uracil reductase [Haloterrigena salina JCM 13891]
MRVVVNAAASADGNLSSRRREQIAISGEADFERVDLLRAFAALESADSSSSGACSVRATIPVASSDRAPIVERTTSDFSDRERFPPATAMSRYS